MLRNLEMTSAQPELSDSFVMSDEELQDANNQLRFLSPPAIISWAKERFQDHVFADTSFGVDSALMWDAVAESGTDIDFTFGDTRFLAPQTYRQRDALIALYGLKVITARPSDEAIDPIVQKRIWSFDSEHYDPETFLDTVKLQPMKRLDRQLGVLATLSASRKVQSRDREALDYVVSNLDEAGNDVGTVRVYPFLDWTAEDVNDYIDTRGLPRNQLPELYGVNSPALYAVHGSAPLSHRNLVYYDGVLEYVPFATCGRNSPNGKPVIT